MAEEVLKELHQDIKVHLQDAYSLGRKVDETHLALKNVKYRKANGISKLRRLVSKHRFFDGQAPEKIADIHGLLEDEEGDIEFVNSLCHTPPRQERSPIMLQGDDTTRVDMWNTPSNSPVSWGSPFSRPRRSRSNVNLRSYKEDLFGTKNTLHQYRSKIQKDPWETSKAIRLVASKLRQYLFQAEELFDWKKSKIEEYWNWLVAPERSKSSFIYTHSSDYPNRRGLPTTESMIQDYHRLVENVRCILERWHHSTSVAVERLAELNALLQKHIKEVQQLVQSLEMAESEISRLQAQCLVLENTYENMIVEEDRWKSTKRVVDGQHHKSKIDSNNENLNQHLRSVLNTYTFPQMHYM